MTILINKKYRLRFIFFDFLCALYFMHNLLPAVGTYTPTIVYAALTAIVFLGCVRRIVYFGSVKFVFFFFPMFLISLLSLPNYTHDLVGFIKFLYSFLQSYLYGLIPITYIVMRDKQRLYYLMSALLICYTVTSITTIIGCSLFPTASRDLASLGAADAEYILYTSRNIGGFSFVYGSVLLVPAIRVLIANKKINRLYGIALIALIGMMVFASEYTIALLSYALTIVILLIPKLSAKKLIILSCLMVGFCIFAGPVLSSVLKLINPDDLGSTRAARFQYIIDSLEGKNAADTMASGDRLSLYAKSLTIFWESSGFGSWSREGIGGHSYIFDTMAVYGVFGIALVLVSYGYYYKKILKNVTEQPNGVYFLWGFLLLLVFAILNPKDNLTYLIFMIPLTGSAAYPTEPGQTDIFCFTEGKNESTLGRK